MGFAFYQGFDHTGCNIFGGDCNAYSHKPSSSLRKIFLFPCVPQGHQGQELSLTTYSKCVYHLIRFSVYKPCIRCNQYGNFCVSVTFATYCGSSLCFRYFGRFFSQFPVGDSFFLYYIICIKNICRVIKRLLGLFFCIKYRQMKSTYNFTHNIIGK